MKKNEVKTIIELIHGSNIELDVVMKAVADVYGLHVVADEVSEPTPAPARKRTRKQADVPTLVLVGKRFGKDVRACLAPHLEELEGKWDKSKCGYLFPNAQNAQAFMDTCGVVSKADRNAVRKSWGWKRDRYATEDWNGEMTIVK